MERIQHEETNCFVTKQLTAKFVLEEKSVIALSEKDAKYWTGADFKIKNGNRLYLVRGLYKNENGEFSLF